MKYQSQGKRSMAWWLQAVKWFGKDSTKGIMRGGEVPTHQVHAALEDLVGRRYVTVEGKSGRGHRPKYHLTETGSRYLDEHDEELKSPVDSDPAPEPAAAPIATGAAVAGEHHPVPAAPIWKGPPMPGTKDHQVQSKLKPQPAAMPPANRGHEIPTPESDIVRHGNSESGASLNTPEKPEKQVPAATIYDPAAADRSKFAAQLRAIVGDFLFDKYADEISVAQLIDYVEAQQ